MSEGNYHAASGPLSSYLLTRNCVSSSSYACVLIPSSPGHNLLNVNFASVSVSVRHLERNTCSGVLAYLTWSAGTSSLPVLGTQASSRAAPMPSVPHHATGHCKPCGPQVFRAFPTLDLGIAATLNICLCKFHPAFGSGFQLAGSQVCPIRSALLLSSVLAAFLSNMISVFPTSLFKGCDLQCGKEDRINIGGELCPHNATLQLRGLSCVASVSSSLKQRYEHWPAVNSQ